MFKKTILFILALTMLLGLTSCGKKEMTLINDLEVGGDWHVWGVYDFAKVGERSVAISKVKSDAGQIVGYDIYADGESLGALLCEIRCEDGAEMDIDVGLSYEDRNGDGLVDIGASLVGGGVMWYLCNADGSFSYSE